MKNDKKKDYSRNKIPTKKNPYEKEPLKDPNVESGRDNPINPQKDEPRKLIL